MNEEIKEMKLRLPAELHERLKQAAGRDHRSMHQQALAYVEQCLDADERRTRSRSRKDHDGS
jgi:predicted HicB family RNase H-like nuclease